MVAGPESEKGTMLLEEPLVWVGPHDDVEDHEGQELELILMQPPCSYRKAAFESLAQAEVQWNMALSANSIQGSQSAVAAGLGISVVPRSAVSKETRIITKGLPELPKTSIHVYNNGIDSHPLIEPFIDFLREEFTGMGLV